MLIQRLRIKDIPQEERPYERLEKDGAEALSNAELLAIIIKTGTKNETSLDIANRLLKMDDLGEGLAFLNTVTLEQLQSVSGIGKVKSIQIKALVELSKRFSSNKKSFKKMINSPEDIAGYVMQEMRYLKQEELRVIVLDTKNRVMKTYTSAVGGLNTSIVEAREIFKEALKAGAASIVLIHNHPSGDTTPSKDDIAFTKKIIEGGELLGMRILDHIIIGDGEFTSLKKERYI